MAPVDLVVGCVPPRFLRALEHSACALAPLLLWPGVGCLPGGRCPFTPLAACSHQPTACRRWLPLNTTRTCARRSLRAGGGGPGPRGPAGGRPPGAHHQGRQVWERVQHKVRTGAWAGAGSGLELGQAVGWGWGGQWAGAGAGSGRGWHGLWGQGVTAPHSTCARPGPGGQQARTTGRGAVVLLMSHASCGPGSTPGCLAPCLARQRGRQVHARTHRPLPPVQGAGAAGAVRALGRVRGAVQLLGGGRPCCIHAGVARQHPRTPFPA